MHKQLHSYNNDQGFVLVTALLILVILTIIGIVATTNTSIELQIAGNDKVHHKTFYEAEGGAMLGAEVLEQAFNCSTGFTKTSTIGAIDVRDLPDPPNSTIRVYARSKAGIPDLILWNNDPPPVADIGDITKADIAYPIANISNGVETGYIYLGGETTMIPGGALQMAAGYEGKGKSAGQGGVAKNFDIFSQFKGLADSESIILFGWRHLVGSEGTCIY